MNASIRTGRLKGLKYDLRRSFNLSLFSGVVAQRQNFPLIVMYRCYTLNWRMGQEEVLARVVLEQIGKDAQVAVVVRLFGSNMIEIGELGKLALWLAVAGLACCYIRIMSWISKKCSVFFAETGKLGLCRCKRRRRLPFLAKAFFAKGTLASEREHFLFAWTYVCRVPSWQHKLAPTTLVLWDHG